MALACGALAASLAADARGQQEDTGTDSAAAGFGSRDSFVFGVENVLGLLDQKTEDDDGKNTENTKGTFQPLWSDLGLFGVTRGGFTYGTLLGLTYLAEKGDDDNDSLTLIRVKPRFGWAGSKQGSPLGFWLRGGPSWFHVNNDGDDSADMLSLGLEAFLVLTPVEHFGVVMGPAMEIPIVGSADGESLKYGSFGLTAGLFGEVW